MLNPNRPLLSRPQAQLLGERRYFDGKPCFYGHVSDHFTDSGRCVRCQRDKRHNWQLMLETARLEDSEPFYRTTDSITA